jgi:pantoate kinase
MFRQNIRNSYLALFSRISYSERRKMKETRAFAPCHITGFFQIFNHTIQPLLIGSKGAGVSLEKGVETRVRVKSSSKSSLEIMVNGELTQYAEASEHVARAALLLSNGPLSIKKVTLMVEHRIAVPVGAGFGTSGASALSLAVALNQALGLNLSRVQAAQLAHTADVECRTGLGTVIAETFGGVEVRVKPGAPGIGKIVQIPTPRNFEVACLIFGPLSTREFLADKETCKRINELGGKLVRRLVKQPTIKNLLRFSRQFAEHLQIMSKRVRRVLDATDGAGFVCSMAMFGESVFTLVERKHLGELLKIFHKYGSKGRIITCGIDVKGVRTLG